MYLYLSICLSIYTRIDIVHVYMGGSHVVVLVPPRAVVAEEDIVFAARIAQRLKLSKLAQPGGSYSFIPQELPAEDLMKLRIGMAEKCGVVRTADGLTSLIEDVERMEDRHGPARALVTAGLMARAALAREESRGGHFRSDHPDRIGEGERTFVIRPNSQALNEVTT